MPSENDKAEILVAAAEELSTGFRRSAHAVATGLFEDSLRQRLPPRCQRAPKQRAAVTIRSNALRSAHYSRDAWGRELAVKCCCEIRGLHSRFCLSRILWPRSFRQHTRCLLSWQNHHPCPQSPTMCFRVKGGAPGTYKLSGQAVIFDTWLPSRPRLTMLDAGTSVTMLSEACAR